MARCTRPLELFCLAWFVMSAASAHAGSAVTISWTGVTGDAGGGTAAVPTLGTYGAVFLSFLVALILWRALTRNRGAVGSALLAVLLATGAAGVAWVSEVHSGAWIVTNATACSGGDSLPDNNNLGFEFQNSCGSTVTLAYDVQSSLCPTVTALQCRDGEGCIEDGEEVESGAPTKTLRDCITD